MSCCAPCTVGAPCANSASSALTWGGRNVKLSGADLYFAAPLLIAAAALWIFTR